MAIFRSTECRRVQATVDGVEMLLQTVMTVVRSFVSPYDPIYPDRSLCRGFRKCFVHERKVAVNRLRTTIYTALKT